MGNQSWGHTFRQGWHRAVRSGGCRGYHALGAVAAHQPKAA